MEDRTITYPLAAVNTVRDRLQDLMPHLSELEADEYAQDIVIDVTMAVDVLRTQEADE